MLDDAKIKNLAWIQNWARRHYLKFVVFYRVFPILSFVNKQGYIRLTKELENNVYFLKYTWEWNMVLQLLK